VEENVFVTNIQLGGILNSNNVYIGKEYSTLKWQVSLAEITPNGSGFNDINIDQFAMQSVGIFLIGFITAPISGILNAQLGRKYRCTITSAIALWNFNSLNNIGATSASNNIHEAVGQPFTHKFGFITFEKLFQIRIVQQDKQ
jgi:hypothetical protein